MLVLGRKKLESLILDTSDGRITITVVDVRGGEVRIGIEAPRSVAVWRKEVQEAIDRENGRGTISS